MGDKEDYLTSYRVFFEKFATTVNPEDQLPVQIGGYPINEAELPGEILYWTSQYLSEKECPQTLLTPLQRIILEEVRIAIDKQPQEFGFNPDDSEYIPLRLMQAVTARVNEVCLRYLDNSRLDTLPPPSTDKVLPLSIAALKNTRRSMEDRHVEISNLESLFGIETTEPTSFYAVYDGHAGSVAASYCAAHLHQYLVESANFRDNLTKAFSDAFIRTDDEFVRKSNEQNVRGGSTAVAVCIRQRKLLAAWAGDSQALLANRMRLMQLVNPHKPNREDEQRRIEASGGTIMYWGTWRVNGQLAVSRAIGDAKCKPYVTASPEVITVDLDGGEDFVVIASDGLWDYVSEDQIALAVYIQIASSPDNLKAVSTRLVQLAKLKGSQDNISVIVVFLKDPHRIVAENPPMEIGLDNVLANPPAFSVDSEACKSPVEPPQKNVAYEDFAADSDSDSEDLGPETAVDVEDVEDSRHSEPAAPTPLVDTVVEEENHIDGVLEDNAAESGEDSEDEWNYIKGEGETDKDQGGSEEPDEPPRSETPCQDNSAWESSSVDMNSSPLNPDAPVFIPGVTGGSEVLLAESPFRPLPMDDSEQPDMEKFVTGALERPNELLDLDNCDQLNGHHNLSLSETNTELMNGNQNTKTHTIENHDNKENSLIDDLERIQRDTTDFCNIQVFQAHTDNSPLSDDVDPELMERLKSKEADPMSMSFYRHDDLNAVHELPDNVDDDQDDDDKENENPAREPDNDLLHDRRNDTHYNIRETSQDDNRTLDDLHHNMEAPNVNVPHTETPESHKLLFEQIPEIPDGKNSQLGFSSEDILDPFEDSARVMSPQDESSQDVDMENRADLETIKQDIAENIVIDDHEDLDAIVPHVDQHLADVYNKPDDEPIILCDPSLYVRAQIHGRIPSPEIDLCPSIKLRPLASMYPKDHHASSDSMEYSGSSQDPEAISPSPELSQIPVDLIEAPETLSQTPEVISPVPEALSPALEELSQAPGELSHRPEELLPASEDLSHRPEAVSPALEALSPGLEGLSPALEALSLAPEVSSPAPEISPSPEVLLLEPEAQSSVPEAISPAPETLSPAPEVLSLAPEASSPAPEALSPAPDVFSSKPEELSQAPIELLNASEELTQSHVKLSQAPEELLETHEELREIPIETIEAPVEISKSQELLQGSTVTSADLPQQQIDFLSEATQEPLLNNIDNISPKHIPCSYDAPTSDNIEKEPAQMIEISSHSEPVRMEPETISQALVDSIETSSSPPLVDYQVAAQSQEITPDIVPTKSEVLDNLDNLSQKINDPVAEHAVTATPPPTPAVLTTAPSLDVITGVAPITATKTATSKATPKAGATPRTPASGTKKPAAKTATPRAASKPATPASKPSTPAAKTSTPAAKSSTPATKPVAKSATPASKPSTPAARTSALTKPAPKPAVTAATKVPAASKPAAARAAPPRAPLVKTSPPKKEAPVKPTATKPLTATSKITAKPAPKTTTLTSITTAAKTPLPRPAPRLTRPASTLAPKKPLTNGDVKPAARPASTLAPKKPLTNGDVKPAARVPARPKPTPRANAAPVTDKSKAAPRPAARAPPRPAGKEKPITKPATTKPPPITKPVAAPEPEALPDVIA